jgi:ribosomal protein S18 acetylase RimI-like enzyme
MKAGRDTPSVEVRRIGEADFDAVLAVYRQCEDFLALGPIPHASPAMVQADLELSRRQGGIFCGVYDGQGIMVGVVDYVPRGFEGNPAHAFLSLLMIAAPYRNRRLGHAVIEWVEGEIRKDAGVCAILAGVQVNNPAAIRFWQRMGYRIVGGPKDYPDGTTAFDLRKGIRASQNREERKSNHKGSKTQRIAKTSL